MGSPICSCQRETGNWGSKDGGAGLVAIFTDLPNFAALVFIQRRNGPVVDDQNVDAAQSCQEVPQAPIGSGQGQFTQQGCSPQIESRVAVTTSFLRQSRCDEALAHAGRTQHENVFAIALAGPASAKRRSSSIRRSIVNDSTFADDFAYDPAKI